MPFAHPSLTPPDEAERQRSLRRYDVLAALHESVFGEFVALAARIFALPISLVSVIDDQTAHYPANVGMPGHHAQPRVEALCATAVLHDHAVVFQDLAAELHQPSAANDEALRTAQANGLGFYAGAPLRTPDGHNLGTLCVIDHAPRPFTAPEQRMLEQLADLASQIVAVRYACLHQPGGRQAEWESVCERLRDELPAFTALLRYLHARHGVQVPVPAEVLAQIERRLGDLREVLAHDE